MTTAQRLNGDSQIRQAGNGRDQVNVVSWSKQAEIAQLSNFAPASIALCFSPDDLRSIGLSRSDISRFCRQDKDLEVLCGSVEGFVQSLKAPSIAEQQRIVQLHGKSAKEAGSQQTPEIEGGERICFFLTRRLRYASPEHRALIEYAIWQKFAQDADSQTAMRWTGTARLTHNLGKFDPKKGGTSLPKQVFTRILVDCRMMIDNGTPAKTFSEILDCAQTDALDEQQWY